MSLIDIFHTKKRVLHIGYRATNCLPISLQPFHCRFVAYEMAHITTTTNVPMPKHRFTDVPQGKNQKKAVKYSIIEGICPEGSKKDKL